MFSFVMHRLPTLQQLVLECYTPGDAYIRELMDNDNCCFRQCLTTFHVQKSAEYSECSGQWLNEDTLELLLLDFLPLFPEFRSFDLHLPEIETLTTIEERIKKSEMVIPNNCRRQLEIMGGREDNLTAKIKEDPKEGNDIPKQKQK